MSDEKIIENMVKYIQDSERELIVSKVSGDIKASKADIVNGILNELEEELKNED